MFSGVVKAWDVTPDEVEEWARSGAAHLQLPELVRRLLLATASVRISTREGAGVFLAGWDLLVDAKDYGPFWPGGVSGWELSTDKNPTKKIRADLEKRVKAHRAGMPAMGFVAVSARRVPDKETYFLAPPEPFTSRSVLDADDLAAWMSLAPVVALWFRELRGELGYDEIRTLKDALRRWSGVTNPSLPEGLLLVGAERQDAAAELRAWAQDPNAKHLSIVADDPHEGALFAAAALALDPVEGEKWSARSAVIRASAGLAALARQSPSEPLILILDGTFPREAIDPKLKIVRAVSRTEPARPPQFTLGPIPWRQMARALDDAGLGDRAEALAHDARGRISALRVLMHGADTPSWASKPEDADALAALLLVGSFQRSNAADMAFVERVLGRSAKEVESLCDQLVRTEGAPVIVDASRRGNVWGFASPGEVWPFLIRRMPEALLRRFAAETVELLTSEPELGPENPARDFFVNKRLESEALVQGVCESLARLSQSNDDLPGHIGRGSELATSVVRAALSDAPRARWASLHDHLRTLAEASPPEFLRATQASLERGRDGPAGLIELETSGLQYPHVGLLRALEVLAWTDNALGQIVAILASLAEADADGNGPGKVIQRPLSTLHSLLDPVLPYTNATEGDILRAIESLQGWPRVAHAFACRAVDYRAGRLLSEPRKPQFLKLSVPTWDEINRCRAAGRFERLRGATTLGTRVAGTDPKKWSELLTAAILDPELVLKDMARVDGEINDSEQVLWTALRRLLHYRARLSTLPRDVESSASAAPGILEHLYERFTPVDDVLRVEWLFRGAPELPFFNGEWQAEQEEILRCQGEALESIYAKLGVGGIVRLVVRVGSEWTNAQILLQLRFRGEIEQAARRDVDAPIMADVYGFMVASNVGEGKMELARVGRELESLVSEGKRAHAVALLHKLDMSDGALDIVDAADSQLRQTYWRTIRFITSAGRKDDERVLRGLLGAGNFRVALEQTLFGGLKISVSSLYEVLLACVTNDELWREVEKARSLTHALPAAFERIRNSGLISAANLGWLVVHFARRSPADSSGLPWLTPLLESDPALFCRWASAPESLPQPSDPQDLTAKEAADVLFAWKGVPWSDADLSIRDQRLYDWAKPVLDYALVSERQLRVIFFLAMTLERARDPDGTWPVVAVRRLLEERRSRDLLVEHLPTAHRNARGATIRTLDAGGRQERVIAARYREDAERLQADWPTTARLLTELAKDYDGDADRHDRWTIAESRQEGFERSEMTGLDVLVAMKLASNGIDASTDRGAWLAEQLDVSRAEIAVSLDVLEKRRFFRGDRTKKLNSLRLRNYLLQSPTPFALHNSAIPDGVGLPTAHSAPVLVGELSDGGPPFVMPLAGASVRGGVIAPIHPRAPLAADRDPKLYELLALLDSLRLGESRYGSAREVELARKKLLETL